MPAIGVIASLSFSMLPRNDGVGTGLGMRNGELELRDQVCLSRSQGVGGRAEGISSGRQGTVALVELTSKNVLKTAK